MACAKPMRADQQLVQAGLARSRHEARALIEAGDVLVRDASGQSLRIKPSTRLPAGTRLEVTTDSPRFASRGGLKLQHALDTFDLPVAGKVCLDAGQSTGGFTDCLLRAGARWVVGVDVGHDQLLPELRDRENVVCIEGVNLRHANREMIVQRIAGRVAQQILQPTDADDPGADVGNRGLAELADYVAAAGFDRIVADLSFISIRKVMPALAELLGANGDLCLLVKPQFELGPGAVNNRGIVRDAEAAQELRHDIEHTASTLGMALKGWTDSPVTGSDGNHEFLAHLVPA